MALSNPGLAELITGRIGDEWICGSIRSRKLEPFRSDPGSGSAGVRSSGPTRKRLAGLIRERTGVTVAPASLFDIQVKRIHEYKRQHLNVLHIITLYSRLRQNPGLERAARPLIFGGKAAPGYLMAKLIIKLINAVAEVVNHDPAVTRPPEGGLLPRFQRQERPADLPGRRSLGTDLTAGKEASGTGNMKFSMNGALTIGTLDGANVEIRRRSGRRTSSSSASRRKKSKE